MTGRSSPRKLLRQALRVLALALCVLALCGCWSRRELNTLLIVLGTALDVGPEADMLKLTAQVAKAGELKAGSDSGPGEKAYLNISDTDNSVLSLLRGLTHRLSRRLYFPHNQVLIFSSELAKIDIAEGLDAFMRDYETRMNVYIIISRGEASEILEEECEIEKIPAIHISRMMDNQKASSETVVTTVRDFGIATLSGSTSPVAPMIELYEASEGKKKARLQGTAVFKRGKMVGELSTAQTRGLLWITGKTKSGVMTVDTPWGQVVLEIMRNKSSLKPVKAPDGSIRMQLNISEDGLIESNETTQDMGTPENVATLKEKMKESIMADVQSALDQARALSADVFGFGDLIRCEFPKEWEALKDIWDTEFAQMELDVEIDVSFRSTGGLAKPAAPGGAE